MDTIYMRERAYRLVESLRRDNQREQRRLDEKLFSKQGLATTHKMHLLALTEEQRKIRQDLSKIKKSSATSWGLLPPRVGEPDHDEDLLRSLTSERLRSEKAERLRTQSLGRSLMASYSDDDFHHSDPILHLSHLESPDQNGEPSNPRRLRKQSLLKLDEESKRIEETLKKFNKAFPTDGSPVSAQNTDQTGETFKENQAGTVASLLPLRKPSKNAVAESKGDEPDGGRKESLDQTKKRLLEPIGGGNLVAKPLRKKSVKKIKRSSQSISPIKRRKSSLMSEESAASRRSSKVSLSVPKALQYLEDEKVIEGVSDEQTALRKGTTPMQSMNVIDVQDARDKIVKRLIGNDSLAKNHKFKSESSKEMRALSPIREQRTELSLASQSMPQMGNRLPSHIETASSKAPKKKKADDGESETPKFDSYKFNPDGSVRTMHLLPDFSGSLEEAKKARYIRHSEKQWFEKELNVSQIFED